MIKSILLAMTVWTDSGLNKWTELVCALSTVVGLFMIGFSLIRYAGWV